ncbi:MAG: phosphate ABC transporter permease PstA [Sphingobacteriaceae bacterium]|nr:phosphate ABC transporter permease PstA [Sphingobacteriaceae bacterium]
MTPFTNIFTLIEAFESWIDKQRKGSFAVYGLIFTLLVLSMVLALFLYVSLAGYPRLDRDFFTGYASRIPEQAGILPAFLGTLWVLFMVAIVSFPLGVAAGIHLEKYVTNDRFSRFLEVNIMNLAGIPSVVYGLLGLQFFVRSMGLGESILAASLTLSLMVLPLVIISTREALRMVPHTHLEAAYALGATKWQTIWLQALPQALPGIVSGTLLAVSRAIGEAAPLLVIGALAFVPFAPVSVLDYFTVLPVQVFFWLSKPQNSFLVNASAAILVLLSITLLLNLLAVGIRERWHKRIQS